MIVSLQEDGAAFDCAVCLLSCFLLTKKLPPKIIGKRMG